MSYIFLLAQFVFLENVFTFDKNIRVDKPYRALSYRIGNNF